LPVSRFLVMLMNVCLPMPLLATCTCTFHMHTRMHACMHTHMHTCMQTNEHATCACNMHHAHATCIMPQAHVHAHAHVSGACGMCMHADHQRGPVHDGVDTDDLVLAPRQEPVTCDHWLLLVTTNGIERCVIIRIQPAQEAKLVHPACIFTREAQEQFAKVGLVHAVSFVDVDGYNLRRVIRVAKACCVNGPAAHTAHTDGRTVLSARGTL
jgi:hypothetical protein